jgi:cbb3-type cytochrome c oxidase subunit III
MSHRISIRPPSGAWMQCTSALLAICLSGAGITRAFAAGDKLVNPEAAKLKNPVANAPEAINKGKALYKRHCASCHGAGGKGDGALALSGGEPSDLTDDVWDYGSTDGEIFVAIRDGVSADMLAYKDKLKERDIWQVVLFLRSIGPKRTE